MLEIVFFTGFAILFYSYLGYGLMLFLINKMSPKKLKSNQHNLPTLTFVVAAFNEESIIEEKILNTLNLEYERNKLSILFVTDGSDDSTPGIVRKYPQIQLLHSPERRGKIAATKRAMQVIESEIVVFSDANTFVNEQALLKIVSHYSDSKVGGVACEKRVISSNSGIQGEGEGLYWKYESFLKKQDSDFYSVVGAAGELFSIRTELFPDIPGDSIIEDFYLSLSICMMGYKFKYEPAAYALEKPSFNVREEMKRKVRIAAGGIQSIVRLRSLLNPFRFGKLSFQYISHRVLRWTLCPLIIPLLLILNIILAGTSPFWNVLLYLQGAFYLLGILGLIIGLWGRENKITTIPLYFLVMNYSVYLGAIRYFRGKQSVIWDKAARME